MKLKDLLHITFAYLVTLGVAWATLHALGGSPIWNMFWADIAATIAIFIFSRLYKNSSFYDAYWSVIPPLIALYWLLEATASGVDTTRAWLVVILVWLWGIRLSTCHRFRALCLGFPKRVIDTHCSTTGDIA